jgi:hypothetical protein
MPISACCAAAAAAVVEHTSSTMRDTLSCERRRVPTTRTTTGAVDCCYCNNEGRWNAGGGDASLLPTIISMPAGIRMYPDNLSEPRTDQQVRLQPLHSLRGAGGTCANYPDFFENISFMFYLLGDCIYSSKQFFPHLGQSKCCLNPV